MAGNLIFPIPLTAIPLTFRFIALLRMASTGDPPVSVGDAPTEMGRMRSRVCDY